MAAVAGSKGRVAAYCGVQPAQLQPSFQASIAARLLAREISPHEAVSEMMPHARLREVGIDTNMTCNLRCRYCYLDDRPVRKGELTVDDWTNTLTPLAEDGCKLFAFIGKEPLLDETAVGVLQRLNVLRKGGLHFRTGMVTNGTQLHKHVDSLQQAKLSYLDVSLDGLPEVNDSWRGAGVSQAVIRNIRDYLKHPPEHDMFVSCVMHSGNHAHIPDFADHLFDLGLPGFFTSPVLKFTRNENIENWAISAYQLETALDNLLRFADSSAIAKDKQIVIDLPYRYAWHLLATGRVMATEVFEDRYEVPFWQPDKSLPVYVKMNVLSYSYWKAVRITHDGTDIANLDLAAHENYSVGAEVRDQVGLQSRSLSNEIARNFHLRFMDEHSNPDAAEAKLFDRAIAAQHHFQESLISPHALAM